MDLPKDLAGSAVGAVGATLRGVGEGARVTAKPIVGGVNALAGREVLPEPVNPLVRPAAALEAAGQRIQDSTSEAYRKQVDATTPTGEITSPRTWGFKGDPTALGAAGQLVRGVGSMAPVVASALLTRGASLPAALGTSTAAAAAQGGGFAAQSEEQRIRDMPQEMLAEVPEYRALLAGGATPDAARSTLATRAGQSAFATTAPVSALSGLIVGGPLTRPIQERLAGAIGGGLLRRVGVEGALEGVAEGTQEVAENAAQVAGANRATGEQRNPMEDSVANFALGAATGGVLGAGSAALHRPGPLTRAAAQAQRFPAAAPGTLADAANAIPTRPGAAAPAADFVGDARGNVADARAPAQDSIDGMGLPIRDAAGERDRQPVPAVAPQPLAEGAPAVAETGAPPAAPGTEVENAAPPSPAPAVPWYDAATGEMRAPTDVEVKDQFLRMFEAASQAGASRSSTAASRMLADEWGVPAARLRALRNEAVAERKAGVTPETRAAQEPLLADEQQQRDDEGLAALDAALAPVVGESNGRPSAEPEPEPAAPSPMATNPGITDQTDERSATAPTEPITRDESSAPPAAPASTSSPADLRLASSGAVEQADRPAAIAQDASAAPPVAAAVPAVANNDVARPEASSVAAGKAPANEVAGDTETISAAAANAPERGGATGAETIDAPSTPEPRQTATGPAPEAPQTAAPTAPAPSADVAPAAPPASQVAAAARESAASPENDLPEPSLAQQAAGNFRMGHLKVHGLDVTIEVPKGGMRRGTSRDGTVWERAASDHYGYIKRTEAADGEQVDVYLGPRAEQPDAKVFVIDQVKPGTKQYDESKAMIGFDNGRAARRSYEANFPAGLKTFGGIREMSIDEFKTWVKDGSATKPATSNVEVAQVRKRPVLRGGIAPNGARVRMVKGKPEYDTRSRETLEAYFKPGAIVPAYAGSFDKVLGFDWNDGRWSVRVREVNADGTEKVDSTGRPESERVHGTQPNARDVVKRLGKPQAPAPKDRSPKKQKKTAADDNTPLPAGAFDLPASGRAAGADDRHTLEITRAVREVTKSWGNNAPIVRVLRSAEELPAMAKELQPRRYRQAGGFYDGKTTYLVAPNLGDSQRALRVLAHEVVGHYGVDRIIDDHVAGGWDRLVTDVDRLRRDATIGSKDIRAAIESVEQRYPNADARTFARELVAVMAERGLRNGLMGRVIAAVRAFVRRMFPNVSFGDAEIRALLQRSEDFIRADDPALAARQAAVQALSFDLAPSTDSEAFKAWFSGSAVIGQNGKPKIVYHGTRAIFDAFQPSRDRGIYFTDTRSEAGEFASEGWSGTSGTPRIEAVYLALKNPLDVDAEGELFEPSMTDRFIREATKGGHDGVIVRNIVNFEGGRPSTTYIAFRPEQVKSATANIGTFNPNDPRIAFSLPIEEEGPHGPVFEAKDYRQAVDALLHAKTGEVRGILSNAASGPVDLLYGQAGTPAKNFNDGYGLAKILAKHPDVDVYSLASELEAATPVARTRNSWQFESPNYRIVLKRDWKGEPKTWLLTAYDPKEKPAATGSTRIGTAPTSSADEIRSSQVAGGGSIAPAKPSGDFSLPGESIDAAGEGMKDGDHAAVTAAKEWMRGKAENLRPAFLKVLQRRHLTELMQEHPALKAAGGYDNEVQQMDAERQQLMAGAPDAAEHPTDMLKRGGAPIAEDLRKFSFVKGPAGWFGRRRPEERALGEVMHEATILGIDPSEPFQPLQMQNSRGEWEPWTKEAVAARIKEIRGQMRGRAGDDKRAMMDEVKRLRALKARDQARKAAYPELVAKYQALPEEGKVLFQQMRDWHAQMRDATEAALVARIEALGKDMLATGAGDVAGRFTRQLVNRIRAEFESNRVEGPYFPLNRDGDFWVSYVDPAGGQGFKMFESADALAAEVKRLRAAGGRVEAQGRRDGDYRAQNAPSGTFVADIIGVLKKSGAPEKVQDEVYQAFLRTLPEMSMRKRSIHRKATPGYSEDITRGFAKAAFHGSHQLARLRHAHVMQSAIDAMQASMDSYRRADGADPLDVARGDALLGEMKRRHDYIMSPTDSQLANTLNGIGFLYFMGASPASALVNLTQNAQVTLPVLGAHHGWPKATRVLGAALRDTLRTFGNIDRTLTNPEERQAYNVLRARGDIDKTQSHTLAGLAEGSLLQANPAWAKVMAGLSWMFHRAEVINREAAGMAAYRLARSRGDNFQEAVQYASDIINGTHFDYSAGNRPRIMQGNTARVALQFKNYSVGMTWVLYRNLYQAFRAESPEARRVARSTLAGVLGMTGLLAGTMGLPIINAIKYAAEAAHALFGDDDEPYDFDVEYRKWLAEHLGEEAAKWVADGAVNRTGVTLSSRVGLSSLWFRDADRELEGKDAYYAFLENVVGPMGGLAKNFFVGSKMVSDGQVWRGVETMLPKFAKDAMKATRFSAEGANTLRGDPIVPDISQPEAFVQLLGFQPTRLFEQQKTNNALKGYEQAILDRRQTLMNAYAMAVHTGTDRDLAMERIIAFNRRYPELALNAESIRQSMRARARYSQQAEGGVSINKKLAPRLREMAGTAPAAG